MSANERSRLKFPLKLDRVAGTTAATPRSLLRPQRDVAAAHADARRREPPSGLGLDSAGVRRRMAERLGEVGIVEPRVLQAFASVPRHHFVDAALATQAYEDTSLRRVERIGASSSRALSCRGFSRSTEITRCETSARSAA